MFAVCIESSHQKGMGHLFRALNFIAFLNKKKKKHIVILNDDAAAKEILKHNGISFVTVDLEDVSGDWETRIIQQYRISVWINDRLDTNLQHSRNVKKNNIHLVSFDDTGDGAELADLNFGMMPCNYEKNLSGKIVKKGIEFFILNEDVVRYKRKRTEMKKILVTLGGSDTYGVTLKVIERIKHFNYDITIVTGPSFIHTKELDMISGGQFKIKKSISSLISEFYEHDIAITGGGITPFEANASGLPCLIIANERHEIENGEFLKRLGTSDYLGYYADIDFNNLSIKEYNIKEMSKLGMERIPENAVERVYDEIIKL